MDMVKLSNLAPDEAKAEGFLRERGILIRFAQCPYCGNKHQRTWTLLQYSPFFMLKGRSTKQQLRRTS